MFFGLTIEFSHVFSGLALASVLKNCEDPVKTGQSLELEMLDEHVYAAFEASLVRESFFLSIFFLYLYVFFLTILSFLALFPHFFPISIIYQIGGFSCVFGKYCNFSNGLDANNDSVSHGSFLDINGTEKNGNNSCLSFSFLLLKITIMLFCFSFRIISFYSLGIFTTL